MVFSHVFDSANLTIDAAGHHTEGIKRAPTHLSLKDLVSPFGPSKRSTPFLEGTFKQSTYRDVDHYKSCTAESTMVSPIIIVGPEHHRLRRCSRAMGSYDVSPTDEPKPLRLPIPSAKFPLAEYSDALPLPHGLRETPLPHESRVDSSSEIHTKPFAHETLLHSQNQEFLTNPNRHETAVTMSSPITYKQVSRRSRSIAIKTPQNASYASQSEINATDEESASNERMYDWATWRMYNRIVDHRRNQRLPSSSHMLPEPSSNLHTMSVPGPSPDYFHDGEVFELEI